MPASFEIQSASGRCDVSIGNGVVADLLAQPGDQIYLVDAFVAASFVGTAIDPIVIVADEPAKSLDRMPAIIEAIKARGATRGTTLVAIGGGVVQDIATFVASVYMRGITWLYAPTTLLSMTDSCIGGKSSVNVGKYKNIVGTFHPPLRILIDLDFVQSLSAEQRVAGLCEAAKICFCRGPATFEQYLALAPSVTADEATFGAVVELSLRSKKWFVEIDEFDRRERLILNFGHTFGHAIETASDYAIGHGIAVGLGMLAALDLGVRTGGSRHNAVVAAFRRYIVDLLGHIDNLADAVERLPIADLLDAFRSDKKHSRENFAVITVNADGLVERLTLPRNGGSDAMIAASFASIQSALFPRSVAA